MNREDFCCVYGQEDPGFNPTPKRTRPSHRLERFVQTLVRPEEFIFRAEATPSKKVKLIVDHYYETKGGFSTCERPKETVSITLSRDEAVDLIKELLEAVKGKEAD